jgi:hypothetical protein|tara:strand:+ start:53 stop:508 length:456 start_codon:yes stop_codon:yes gene_type:complete
MNLTLEDVGLQHPDKVIKNDPLWTGESVTKALAKIVNNNPELYFNQKERNIMKEITNATDIMDKAIEHFDKSYKRFELIETAMQKNIKTKAGDIKAAEEKLMQGLARIERAANFDRLQQYVTLIERASSAMKILADLETEGRLDKIATAIR